MFPVVPSIAEVPGEYSSFILDLKQRIQQEQLRIIPNSR